MKTKKKKSLSSIQYDTLWMAIRYAMGRKSIASLSLPWEIIDSYRDELFDTSQGKHLYKMLMRDVVRDNMVLEMDQDTLQEFKNNWLPLIAWLNPNNRYTVHCLYENVPHVIKAIKVCGEFRPYENYRFGPTKAIIDPSAIISITKNGIELEDDDSAELFATSVLEDGELKEMLLTSL